MPRRSEFKQTFGPVKELEDATMHTVKVHKRNKTMITVNQIRTLSTSLQRRFGNDVKLRIRALGPDRWTTLKTFETELDIQDEEDYYKGKVRETAKFMEFFQLEFVILTPREE